MPYESQADIRKNRLYIKLDGFLSDAELKAAADLVISEAKKLKPGYSAINDISTFKPASRNGSDEIARAQVFMKESGAGHIVRVVGEKVLGSLQFKRTQNSAGYVADHVTTWAEAEKMLDDLEKESHRHGPA